MMTHGHEDTFDAGEAYKGFKTNRTGVTRFTIDYVQIEQ
jgi:hypothetical protein